MSGDVLHPVGEITTGCWRRQRLPVSLVQRDGVFHDLTELFEDGSLVVAMTTAQKEPGALPT